MIQSATGADHVVSGKIYTSISRNIHKDQGGALVSYDGVSKSEFAQKLSDMLRQP